MGETDVNSCLFLEVNLYFIVKAFLLSLRFLEHFQIQN